MQQRFLVQAGGAAKGRRVCDLVKQLVEETGADRIGVSVAYASVSGLRALLALIPNIGSSQWLVGLDDLLTHPSVFDVLASIPNAQVRVAGEDVSGYRFHPKIYWVSAAWGARSGMIIGSANLTHSGLFQNVEAVVSMRAQGRFEVQQLEREWRTAWDIGSNPTKVVLARYREDFVRAFKRRRVPAQHKGPILDHDGSTVDPSVANAVWIEVGKITGFQSEQLEIKAEQALFFGLPMHGGLETAVRVGLASGQLISIPVKYRGNAMWRFNLPAAIPEVAAGLRPGGGRSPFIAVFERTKSGDLKLRFVRVESDEARQLRKASRERGTLGSTTARAYGWF